MGLDMYMYRREIDGNKEPEQVAEWRKANQIFKWLEDNVCDGVTENCASYVVDEEQLECLRDTCGKVINIATFKGDGDHISNAESVAKILPCTNGFFFGSDKYDRSYMYDVKYTYATINEILEETDFDTQEIVYHAWW